MMMRAAAHHFVSNCCAVPFCQVLRMVVLRPVIRLLGRGEREWGLVMCCSCFDDGAVNRDGAPCRIRVSVDDSSVVRLSGTSPGGNWGRCWCVRRGGGVGLMSSFVWCVFDDDRVN